MMPDRRLDEKLFALVRAVLGNESGGRHKVCGERGKESGDLRKLELSADQVTGLFRLRTG